MCVAACGGCVLALRFVHSKSAHRDAKNEKGSVLHTNAKSRHRADANKPCGRNARAYL